MAFFANSTGLVINKLNDNKNSAFEMTDKSESTDEKAGSEKDSNDEKYNSNHVFLVLKPSTALISHQYIFTIPKITLGIFMPPPELV